MRFTQHPISSEQVAAVARHIAENQQPPVQALAVEFLAYSGLRAVEFRRAGGRRPTAGPRRPLSRCGPGAAD